MSMHTTEEWEQHARLNMTFAQTAQQKAHEQCNQSKRAHEGTVVDNLSMYNQLHETMKQKVNNSYRLIDKLQKRADSLEGSLEASRASLASLEKSLFDKDVPLQVCTWRLEQREKRPLREQVHDVVEVALEEEKSVLVETQRRLSDAIARTKAMIGDLQNNLKDVRTDIEHKVQALSVDEMCLRTTERSMHTMVERTPPPPTVGAMRSPNSLKMTRHQVSLQESSKNEVVRQQDAERLNRAAAMREDTARAMREDNAKLSQRCESIANDAQAKSEKRMQDRVQENQQMRRRLEGEIRETQARMDHTKNTISETKYQIKALEEPMDLTASCASWRKQRATKEHIVDPVSTVLQQHRMTVLQAHQDLVGHHQSEKSNLKELQDRRERLREDLRDKTASLHIDLNCLTHMGTKLNGKPTLGLSDKKLTRAMKLDRSFVPGMGAATAR